MTFISYAQNFEDVMLWRALKDIERGFYIDVGAWSPDFDSVTRAFYEAGWTGINIEPNSQFYSELVSRRQSDINLDLAVSDVEGQKTMYFVENPGLSTLCASIAEKHRKAGWRVESRPIQVQTLARIWEKYVSKTQHVHFLKVDVEGAEEAVLLGNDWEKHRPWIVLVEAMQPMEPVPAHQQAEAILVNGGYVFAYADGLNRFYVAEEKSELLDSFQYPPNIFDGFGLAVTHEAESMRHAAEQRAATAEEKANAAEEKANAVEEKANAAGEKACAAEEKATAAEQKANAAEQKANAAEQKANAAVAREQALANSMSWRLTAPLRLSLRMIVALIASCKRFLRCALSAPKVLALKTYMNLVGYIARNPKLTAKLELWLSRVPTLRRFLSSLYVYGSNQQSISISHASPSQAANQHMNSRATKMHTQITAARRD